MSEGDVKDAAGSPSGAAKKVVAIEASALLRESLKSALAARGFEVRREDLSSDPLEIHAELLIFEVTSESEELAQQLLTQLSKTALVFIGPTEQESAARRHDVRELSADVSVAEVVRVCQQMLFGTAPSPLPRPPKSQTSTPFSVLRRPSEPPPSRPPPSISSSPAPLLPSSAPPSSRPSGSPAQSSAPPPTVHHHVSRPPNSLNTPELSAEVGAMLEQAERRVAASMRSRPSIPPPPEPRRREDGFKMSPEIQAALEDPIGDYDVVGQSEIPRSDPSRSTSTQAAAGDPEAPAPDEGADGSNQDARKRPEVTAAVEEVPRPGSFPTESTQSTGESNHAASPMASIALPTSEPGTKRTPAPQFDSQRFPTSSGNSPSDQPGIEPVTARPPAPSGAAAQLPDSSPKPAKPPSKLPPDPPVPSGEWVGSAIGRSGRASPVPEAPPASEPPSSEEPNTDAGRSPLPKPRLKTDRPQSARLEQPESSPTQSGDQDAPATVPPRTDQQARRAPTVAPTPRPPATRVTQPGTDKASTEQTLDRRLSSAAPPASSQVDPTGAELSQLEIPPLREGDAIRVLARAIRSRFTGAATYETDAGIRRIVLREGDFVTAASSVKSESLLAFLVERGNLEQEVSNQLGHKLPNFGRHAGAALIASGHLAQDQLWPVLRAHAEFIVGQALAMGRGVAAYETTVPERLMAEPSVFGGATGSEVLVEIMRRVISPTMALRALGGEHAQLGYGPNRSLLDECALTRDEQEALEQMLNRPLSDALGDVGSLEFPCVLLALVELGVLTPSVKPGLVAAAESPHRRAHDRLDDEALRRAIRNRRALVDNADYFSLLGVPRSATGYDIRRAYLELKRQFDPSTALTTGTADLVDDVDLIQDVLDEAYEILHDQLKRDRYRRAIESSPAL